MRWRNSTRVEYATDLKQCLKDQVMWTSKEIDAKEQPIRKFQDQKRPHIERIDGKVWIALCNDR